MKKTLEWTKKDGVVIVQYRRPKAFYRPWNVEIWYPGAVVPVTTRNWHKESWIIV